MMIEVFLPRGRFSRLTAAALLGLWILASRTSDAYPTAIVFAPNGDIKSPGDLGFFAFTAVQFAPSVEASTAWIGFQIGAIGPHRYGGTKLAFGGLEMGFDAILSDEAGTPQAYVKPMFNLKVGLLTEWHDSPTEADGWIPHMAAGIQDVAAYKFSRSLNLAYLTGTEPLNPGGVFIGRVTVGLGGVANEFSAANSDVFSPTWPFPGASHLLLLAGYEFPPAGPFSFAIDLVGGVSEVSSTNAAVFFTPIDGATVALGLASGNEFFPASAWNFGGFLLLLVNFNVIKVFTPAVSPKN